MLIGDDTRATLDAAPCPVAIAPADYANSAEFMREIAVGYDGSPESEEAVAMARELAAQCGARLSAFQAVVVPVSTFSAGPALFREAIAAVIDETRERIAALGGIEAHAAYGDSAMELAAYSASVDLLIVGSRGHGPLTRLVHGSVSRKLAGTSHCPLLVLTGTPNLTAAETQAATSAGTRAL